MNDNAALAYLLEGSIEQFGVENQLTVDFLECLRGNENQVGNTYLSVYDGVTLPGFTRDGRTGASVNHMTLAAGIALFKESNHQAVISYWETVADHWREAGCWFIEDGTRNTYFQWILLPSLAAANQGAEVMKWINNSVWARLALGASSQKARFGEVMKVPYGIWRGYATTWAGARSWRYNSPHWSHLEKNTSDWVLHWAVNNNLSEAPNHWVKDCIDTGAVPNGLSSAQRADLQEIIYGETGSLERVVEMLNGCGPREACGMVRTHDGVATMYVKSFNGNTAFLYGAVFDHLAQWHQWLGHGNGGRGNVKQGTAFANGTIMECIANDGSQGPTTIAYPTGDEIYKVYSPGRAEPWQIEGETVPPPTDPPPTDPPDDDALSQEDRDHYSFEVQKMSNRQADLSLQLNQVKTAESDLEVSEQLGHQGNKANRLSNEIKGILDA